MQRMRHENEHRLRFCCARGIRSLVGDEDGQKDEFMFSDSLFYRPTPTRDLLLDPRHR